MCCSQGGGEPTSVVQSQASFLTSEANCLLLAILQLLVLTHVKQNSLWSSQQLSAGPFPWAQGHSGHRSCMSAIGTGTRVVLGITIIHGAKHVQWNGELVQTVWKIHGSEYTVEGVICVMWLAALTCINFCVTSQCERAASLELVIHCLSSKKFGPLKHTYVRRLTCVESKHMVKDLFILKYASLNHGLPKCRCHI